MAEQSVGMTTGTGDGTVGGYVNTRMTQKDKDNLGSGVLLNNQPSITYPAGGVQISACAFNVQGYYYQNTTAITITTTGVSPGTYNLVCRVNDTGSAETVIRSASGTTIPARTVRLCLVSAIDLSRDVYLAVVTVAGGNASGIDQWMWTIEQSPSISQAFTVLLNKTTTQNIVNANVPTDITWDTKTASQSSINTLYTNGVGLRTPGVYIISGFFVHALGSTGSRTVQLVQDAVVTQSTTNLLSAITPSMPGSIPQHFTFQVLVPAWAGGFSSDLGILFRIVSSVANQNIDTAAIRITRI